MGHPKYLGEFEHSSAGYFAAQRRRLWDADTTRDRGACRNGHRDRRLYLTSSACREGFRRSSLGEASEVRGDAPSAISPQSPRVGKCCSARCRRSAACPREWGSWSRNERSAPACHGGPDPSSGLFQLQNRIWHAWIVDTHSYPAFYHPTVLLIGNGPAQREPFRASSRAIS